MHSQSQHGLKLLQATLCLPPPSPSSVCCSCCAAAAGRLCGSERVLGPVACQKPGRHSSNTADRRSRCLWGAEGGGGAEGEWGWGCGVCGGRAFAEANERYEESRDVVCAGEWGQVRVEREREIYILFCMNDCTPCMATYSTPNTIVREQAPSHTIWQSNTHTGCSAELLCPASTHPFTPTHTTPCGCSTPPHPALSLFAICSLPRPCC